MAQQEMTLAEMLMQGTKACMINSANFLKLKINRSKKKDDLSNELAQAILNAPLQLLERIPEKQVLKLQKMTHDKRGQVVMNRLTMVEDCISQMGISNVKYQGKLDVEFISKDLAKALLPVIDNFVNNYSERIDRRRQEQIILGLLNLYGMLNIEELTQYFNKYIPKTSETEVGNIIQGSYLLSSLKEMTSIGSLYFSPYVRDIDSCVLEIESRKHVAPANFSMAEVMAAGESDFPVPPLNEQTKKFHQLLKTIKMPDKEIKQWTSSAWIGANHGEGFFQLVIGMIVTYAELIIPKAKQMNYKNSATDIVIGMIKAFPTWTLRGNSPNYVTRKYEGTPIPTDTRMEAFANERKASVDSSIQKTDDCSEQVINPFPKVGRNEPCPCGSGKKYKHCCGKK